MLSTAGCTLRQRAPLFPGLGWPLARDFVEERWRILVPHNWAKRCHNGLLPSNGPSRLYPPKGINCH